MSDASDWAAAITRHRQRKAQFYADHPQSPLPADHRGQFEGLDYFPPDPAFRFRLPLHEYDPRETIVVETTTDGTQAYLRWAEFRFEIDGTDLSLQAYKAGRDENRLWVPFRDATSGETTYGGGRYLDLEADEHRTAVGHWILDFNQAYNPYCAYADHYECPLVPIQNWLDVPVEAGEKAYEPPAGASRAH